MLAGIYTPPAGGVRTPLAVIYTPLGGIYTPPAGGVRTPLAEFRRIRLDNVAEVMVTS